MKPVDPIAVEAFVKIDREAKALGKQEQEAREALNKAEAAHRAIQTTWSKAYQVLMNAVHEAASDSSGD